MGLLTGLQTYWTFDAYLGRMWDSTRNYNHLSRVGSGDEVIAGQVSNAWHKNSGTISGSTNPYLIINGADQRGLNIYQDLTICCWFKTPNVTTGARNLIWRRGSQEVWWITYAQYAAGKFGFSTATTVAQHRLDNTTTPSNNTWYHLAFTYQRSDKAKNIYVNGNGDGSATASHGNDLVNDTTAAIRIGLNLVTPSDSWDVTVDEMGIWNRVLSQAEVQSLYNSGSGLAYPFGEVVPQPAQTSILISSGSGTGSAVTVRV